MKNGPSKYLEVLAREFSKLPGIGLKSGSRLAFHMLGMNDEAVLSFTQAVINLKKNIVICEICSGISDSKICSICSDNSREKRVICVVESAKDILTIESSNGYHGLYHVLNGVISPLDGIGPEELNIKSLIERCQSNEIEEIIIALNPTIEGDATSLYLSKLLSSSSIHVARIAHGLPVGGDIEFADGPTIIKSIEGRVKI